MNLLHVRINQGEQAQRVQEHKGQALKTETYPLTAIPCAPLPSLQVSRVQVVSVVPGSAVVTLNLYDDPLTAEGIAYPPTPNTSSNIDAATAEMLAAMTPGQRAAYAPAATSATSSPSSSSTTSASAGSVAGGTTSASSGTLNPGPGSQLLSMVGP